MEEIRIASMYAGYIVTITGFFGMVWKILKMYKEMVEGQRCQLRAYMLQIYYHNVDNKEIRQYEMENFLKMYAAYKAMGGNSFVDEIHQEVTSWKIIT